MNKIFTLALLAIFGLNASAQEVTLDFSSNDDWNLPTDYVKTEATYTNASNGITLTFGASNNGHKINTSDKYLIFGKKDATLTIGSFDFAVERIDLVGRSGASGAVKQNFYVGDEAVSTETTGATATNMYNIAEAYQSAGSFTLKINSAHNTQITQILIWKKGSGSKQAAGLSWGTNSRTVTIGADDNVFPTLTNENNLSITYTSSNESVATIDANGAITLVAAGKTDITASFEGNDEYEAQTVTYALTVKTAIDDNAKGQKNNPYLLTDEELSTLLNTLNTDARPKSDQVYVKGYITDIDEVSTGFGNATFKIAAVKGDYNAEIKLKAYRCNYLEKSKFTAEDQIMIDDEVIICGQLQFYSGEPQLIQGCYIYSQNGTITTGISSVKSAAAQNGAIYNIAGQKVSASYKGLVIMNGKKYVNK